MHSAFRYNCSMKAICCLPKLQTLLFVNIVFCIYVCKYSFFIQNWKNKNAAHKITIKKNNTVILCIQPCTVSLLQVIHFFFKLTYSKIDYLGVCSSTNYNKSIDFCNHHHDIETEWFHQPPNPGAVPL